MSTKIAAWSFSRWHTWMECPRKAKYKFIDKLKEPDSPQMQRGTKMHELAQDVIHGGVPSPLIPEAFYPDLVKLARLNAVTEENWAFDQNWVPTGYFAPNCWCRIKTDAYVREDKVGYVIDFKTGKKREEHNFQMELYALAALVRDTKSIDTVSVQLWYFDLGDRHNFVIGRQAVEQLMVNWNRRVKPMLEDGQFEAHPGYICGWCHFRKSNGGPCEHG